MSQQRQLKRKTGNQNRIRQLSQAEERQDKKSQITRKKIRGHLKTINTHKLLVMRGCFSIGLYRQGLLHDLSKYTPSELLEGFRYYEDGMSSPNNGERRDKGYSEAWMHHKGRNRHHFEYWLDYRLPSQKNKRDQKTEGGGENMPCRGSLAEEGKFGAPYPLQAVQVPRRYVAEMLMDRIAASKNYNKEAYTQHDALAYFEKGMGHYLMHPQTRKELHGMLRILDERGEKELIRFVKDYYLKGYPI